MSKTVRQTIHDDLIGQRLIALVEWGKEHGNKNIPFEM